MYSSEYGLPSWRNLQNYVDWVNIRFSQSRKDAVPLWLDCVYGHESDRPRPTLGARMIAERPDLGQGELFLACASGDETALRAAVRADPNRLNQVENPWIRPSCKNPLGDAPAGSRDDSRTPPGS